jgi:hypothetical protein
MLRFYLATRQDTPFATDLLWYQTLFSEQSKSQIVRSPGEADIVVLFESYGHHDLEYAMRLLDCPFIRDHLQKLFTINHNDIAWPLLRGCYTSLSKLQCNPSTVRAINYPSVYNWEVETASQTPPTETPIHLASFQGSIDSHVVRARLHRFFVKHPTIVVNDAKAAWFAHSELQKTSYIDSIRRSWFSLCPRGNSPSTYRLYESMALGRCPVIISDQWAPPRDIPWEECSITVAENDVPQLESILRRYQSHALQLGSRARELWLQSFHHQTKFRYYASQISELAQQPLPSWCQSTENYRRHWKSWSYRQSVGFTLPQRLLNKFLRSLGSKLSK